MEAKSTQARTIGRGFKLKSIPGQEEGPEVRETAPGLRLFLEWGDS